ncbi:ankyrin repeat domain-containing protein 16-like isoform X2 [Branchiostoma floridae]|uniref:Ankyrin repeat domain-containing protein 16-like isoform X2 n=1 Tax=Branchiostoma floridae TaxID=7739 RepID=A0A9J7MNL4_BRAFL|nr:ankyrin repeat domain-containing protein 16-like isoform X2 [Branchiostoma floridae]
MAMAMPELCQLAQQGDLPKIRALLASSPCPDRLLDTRHRKSGDSVLHYAARHGHLSVLRYLCEECGLSPETGNVDGKRPLHEAAQAGQTECVRYLISSIQINVLKRADWTPIMLACTKTNLTVVQLLRDAGADLTIRNKDGWNCFHVACREGDVDILSYLLDCDGTLWESVSTNGRTPLHTASLHGCVGATQVLLQRCNYAPDTPDSCGSTPLMDAVRADNIDLAQLLVKQHGADVQKLDTMGRQPLHLAAQAGCIQAVRYLLTEHGIPVDTPAPGSGLTALHFAAKEGQTDAVKLLVRFGSNVNIKDDKGRTALHMASGGQHAECVRVLLTSGAVDGTDRSGNTAEQLARKKTVKDIFRQIN